MNNWELEIQTGIGVDKSREGRKCLVVGYIISLAIFRWFHLEKCTHYIQLIIKMIQFNHQNLKNNIFMRDYHQENRGNVRC